MQENILAANPTADLDVYVVWEPMLGAQRSQAVVAMDLLPDPRVRHYWNDTFLVGDHFRQLNFGRTAWDIYFLYGREATWQEMPEPLILSGYTVISRREALAETLTALWRQ